MEPPFAFPPNMMYSVRTVTASGVARNLGLGLDRGLGLVVLGLIGLISLILIDNKK